MARSFLRDPLTGRFVSPAVVGLQTVLRTTILDSGQSYSELIGRGPVEEAEDEAPRENWREVGGDRQSYWTADDELLDADALAAAEFPAHADAFRVIFKVDDNPDYGRGYASSDWMSPGMWPPDPSMSGVSGTVGIDRIRFRNA